MPLAKSDSAGRLSPRERLGQFRDSHHKPAWWFFPDEIETKVQGFLGTGPIFIIGDQPSFSPWNRDDSGRRALYDVLAEMDAGNYHLTDLYKRQGRPGELRRCRGPNFRVQHCASRHWCAAPFRYMRPHFGIRQSSDPISWFFASPQFLASISINFPTVANDANNYFLGLGISEVENPIITDTDSPAITISKLLAALREWITFKS